tara:strand:+ start:214 stop:1809 length:1596 start_codon:yes stop_codon:yes gene_type:complete
MARLTEALSLKTGLGDSYEFSLSEEYSEVFNLRQEVDNSDAFIKLVGSSSSISAQNLQNVRSMVIKNHGKVGAEIQIKLTEYTNNSNVDDANSVDTGGGATVSRYASFLLGAGEYIFMPNVRWVGYNAAVSAANAKPTTSGDYLSLASSLEVDSGIQLNDAGVEAADTSITVDDGDVFRVGDLIQLGVNDTTATRIEIMRVTAIATHLLTVERALYGTSAADKDNQTDATSGAVDNAKVYFPIFNTYGDYDSFSVVQTDASGRFGASNFFGYGRVADSTSDGIVPGSVAGKFYEAGYQACGMKGITPQTNSGLTTSTAYYFKIAVDGGTALEISFTTDASNVNFGGTNGIIRKIQDSLDTQFYTEGHLFEKKVNVAIVDGDLRFTSGQHLSTSAIALSAGVSGTADTDELFDGSNRIARFPASPSGAVAAKLPPDTIIDDKGVTIPNSSVFFYDDGHGNIRGTATGTINYQTGAIDFIGLPNAEFAITANYDSAHGGGANAGSATENVISSVSARSCNSKINCPIEIVAFN